MSTSEARTSSGLDASTSPTVSRAGRRAWTVTGLLVLLYTVNMADKTVLGIIAQPLSDELGFTAAQIGLVGSLFFIPYTIGGLFAGTITRFVSLRWALAGLAVLWALTMLPMVIAAGFAVLVVSRMLLGLTEGPSAALIHTANFSWHAPARRALPGAAVNGAAPLAKIVLAPLLAFLTVTYGWRAALIALVVLGLLWCLLWLPLWSDGPYIGSRGDADGATDEPPAPWTSIFTTRTFITLSLATMSIGLLLSVVMTWLPSYFELGLGYSRLQAGSMVALPAVTGLAMMVLMSMLGDRMTSRGTSSRVARVIVPCAGIVVSGLLLGTLPVLDTPALAVLAIILAYGFLSCGAPLLIAGVSDICPPRQIAGMLGVFTAVFGLGGVIGPYATGLIVDASANPGDGYATAFALFGLLSAVFAAAALILADPDRDKLLVQSRAARPNAESN